MDVCVYIYNIWSNILYHQKRSKIICIKFCNSWLTRYLASNWMSDTLVLNWIDDVDYHCIEHVYTKFNDKTRWRNTQNFNIDYFVNIVTLDDSSDVLQFYQNIQPVSKRTILMVQTICRYSNWSKWQSKNRRKSKNMILSKRCIWLTIPSLQ